MSEKTLERLVKQYIGMSPKLFSRIMRFQSSLDLLRESKFKNLTTLSYQSDYYDQSHYIREFKEFTGVSPKEFIKSSDEQLINFPLFKSEE
ncbi:helix-turn-helix domain-containing protein [Myroides odoratimimus]|nr:helix-turn-helix domain-containing protein [Myroides odoratimimus]WHT75212.1 helix-turn-helix domain-containing protein [Myroides odoratimimus]WHU39796.1 helix-turn-helix domain-containing protein [Myroides odoratimimus]